MKRNLKRWVSLLLMAVMLITMMPVTATAANESDTFYRIFHLDVGRKYFTVDQVKGIIDTLHTNNYTHLELAIGNDGLRLLLDDMSISANSTTYDSEKVKAGIQQGNKNYSHAGEWSQTEMDEIISYAKSNKIEIIPLVNTPGHMDAILDAMEAVGITDGAFSANGKTSARTIDIQNETAVEFTKEIIKKYAQYFKSQGCTLFNMGADEYANDILTNDQTGMGFGYLQSKGLLTTFAKYINELAGIIKGVGMTPMAFNDGFYYNGDTSAQFDKDIIITYWSAGWGGIKPASVETISNQGHKLINTNEKWYYVLGRDTGTYGYSSNKASSVPVTEFVNGNKTIAPIGAMQCVWSDDPSVSYEEGEATRVITLIETFSKSNPTYFVASTEEPDAGNGEEGGDNSGDAGNQLKEKTITVSVGGTEVVEIQGKNLSGEYLTENTTIASVESVVYDQQPGKEETTLGDKVSMSSNGTYTGVISDGNENYLVLDSNGKISNTKDIKQATNFNVVRSGNNYTISNGTYYLTTSTYPNELSTSTRAGSWSYSNGFYRQSNYTSHNYYLYCNNGTWQTTSYSYSSNRGALYSVTTTTEPAIDKTTITFKGNSVGTTYVTIGDTRYTINVVEEKLEDVAPLRTELWITNYGVESTDANISATEFATGDSARPKGYYVSINAKDVYGEKGTEISSLVPSTGAYEYSNELVYWKGTCLDVDNHQTASESDKTAAGNDFTYIRYYGGKWAYSVNQSTWKEINVEDDQIVAYYLQKTKLKDENGAELAGEVDVLVKDWGFEVGKGDGTAQVALSFAFVYPDGTLSASESDIYTKYTTMFNYWDNRNIGIVAPISNTDYEIGKITVTSGERTSGSSSTWGTSAGITWDKVENEAGQLWYDETEYWNDSMETTPMVNGENEGIVWPAKNTAYLVLIYLKPVHYDTNLIVNWVDDSNNKAVISNMEVLVSSDSKETTFYNGLNQESPLPEENVGGNFTLDDNAYVVNRGGKKQTFNKDITTIPGVAAQYTSGLYEYTGADLSADGKTLTLHYNINSAKLSKNYIVDFGLPVNVPLSDLVEHSENVSKVEVTSGSAVVNSDKSITYTPQRVLSGSDAVRVKVHYANSSETFTIGFTPATTVYYEETFATFENGTNKGTAVNNTQKKSLEASKEHYGYDDAYADDGAQASNGTYVELGTGGKGEFTFNGTGVDIYTNSTPNTGKVMLYLYQGETLKKLYTVDTKMANGSSNATNSQAVSAHNVPIVTIKGLESGTYTVKMEVVKTKVTAEDGTTSKVVLPVNIDGFRVYGTLPLDSAAYTSDLEDNPEYYQLRDMVLNAIGVSDVEDSQYGNPAELAGQVYDASAGATGIITDESVTYANSSTVKDLLDNGPKNEIYLYANQTLTFKVQSSRLLQLGMKALDASTNYTLKVDGKAVKDGSMNTSVDMFYKLNETSVENHTYTVSLTNNGTGILAITELKICDDPNAAFVELTAEDIEKILVPTEYADATLNIALNDAAGNSLATTALTSNGVVGETATFTATAIEEAVATLVPEGYELKDVSYADQEVAYGEEASVTFTAEEVEEEQPEVGTGIFGAIASAVKNFFNKIFGWL